MIWKSFPQGRGNIIFASNDVLTWTFSTHVYVYFLHTLSKPTALFYLHSASLLFVFFLQ